MSIKEILTIHFSANYTEKDENWDKNWGSLQAMVKEFKTGSVGFYANGKLTDPETGKRYQVSCNIVEIGSKPKG